MTRGELLDKIRQAARLSDDYPESALAMANHALLAYVNDPEITGIYESI